MIYLQVINSFSRDPEKVVRPLIPLTTCIKNFAKADVIDGFYSTALERKSVVRKYENMKCFKHIIRMRRKLARFQ